MPGCMWSLPMAALPARFRSENLTLLIRTGCQMAHPSCFVMLPAGLGKLSRLRPVSGANPQLASSYFWHFGGTVKRLFNAA